MQGTIFFGFKFLIERQPRFQENINLGRTIFCDLRGSEKWGTLN